MRNRVRFAHLEHPRRAAPYDSLQLRPAGQPLAARRSPSPGAALPDADPRLFAPGHTGYALPQLAARSLRQLRSAPGLPERGDRAGVRGRPRRRHDGHQPVRLLSREGSRDVSVRVRAGAAARPRALPAPGVVRAEVRRVRRGGAVSRGRHGAAHDRRARRPQPLRAGERAVRHPHGARGFSPRGDPDAGSRVVPRFRVAARSIAPSARARRAIRVRLLHSAPRRREAASRARGRRARLDRPSRLGRGVPAGRGLDRARRDERPPLRRRAHPARLHRRAARRRAPVTVQLTPGARPAKTTRSRRPSASR